MHQLHQRLRPAQWAVLCLRPLLQQVRYLRAWTLRPRCMLLWLHGVRWPLPAVRCPLQRLHLRRALQVRQLRVRLFVVRRHVHALRLTLQPVPRHVTHGLRRLLRRLQLEPGSLRLLAGLARRLHRGPVLGLLWHLRLLLLLRPPRRSLHRGSAAGVAGASEHGAIRRRWRQLDARGVDAAAHAD